jgi:hypothetical protein
VGYQLGHKHHPNQAKHIHLDSHVVLHFPPYSYVDWILKWKPTDHAKWKSKVAEGMRQTSEWEFETRAGESATTRKGQGGRRFFRLKVGQSFERRPKVVWGPSAARTTTVVSAPIVLIVGLIKWLWFNIESNNIESNLYINNKSI